MAWVEIRCYATLRECLPEGAKSGIYNYETNKSTIKEVVKELALPEQQLHLIMKNGVKVEIDEPIQDGDRIGFFPPIGGG